MCIIDKKQSIISRYDDSIIIIRKLILFHVYLLLSYIKKKKKTFSRIIKICEEGTIAGEIFQPFLRDNFTRAPDVSRKG